MAPQQKLAFHWSEPLIIIAVYLSLLLWTFVDSGYYLFSYPFNVRDGSIYWALIIGGLGNATLFGLTAYFLIPQFLSQQQYLKFAGLVILLFAASTSIEYLIEGWMKSVYDLPANIRNLYTLNYQTPIRDIGGPAWAINLFVLFMAFIYRFGRDWMMHERHKRQLIELQLGTELKLLRSQIHPHFLFNTLNNIYSITRKNKDEEASIAIGKLSSILRFMLTNSDDETIALSKEIDYIRNLIEIQHLRVAEDELVVNFEVSGDINDIRIAPMILIPFVENAFKYGIDIRSTSVIDIKLEVRKEMLLFKIKNAKNRPEPNALEEASGIGISNVSRRLDLIYGIDHKLEITDENNLFIVELKISF